MKRLAIYAHHSPSPVVAGHVLYCLRQIAELGFQVAFVSNSELSADSAATLQQICDRVMVRENTGLDFGMWQRGLAKYDVRQFSELLLTNSSIIGPMQSLAAMWQSPLVADADFWGLTDNEEYGLHLQSYFLVFREQALHSARFRDFWQTVLPYKSKSQVIFSYELGLSSWLEEGGFRWRAVFPQAQIVESYRARRSWREKYRDQYRFLHYFYRNRRLPGPNTTLLYPDLLLERGMPFLKASLLQQKSLRIEPAQAFALLKRYDLPAEYLDELGRAHPSSPA